MSNIAKWKFEKAYWPATKETTESALFDIAEKDWDTTDVWMAKQLINNGSLASWLEDSGSEITVCICDVGGDVLTVRVDIELIVRQAIENGHVPSLEGCANVLRRCLTDLQNAVQESSTAP